MLAQYEQIIRMFVDGRTTAQQFEAEYLDAFKMDSDQVTGSEFDILDALFADVDDYVADPILRAEFGGLDDNQLRDRARGVYDLLF